MDLYNKYRPRAFEDMYMTSRCVATFASRVSQYLAGDTAKLAKNYIFHSSEPGLGKTTSGRILASILNPTLSIEEREALFNGGENPVFKEINGGDYNKVDDFRQLAEEIKYRRDSMFGYRYVYMINEAHNITRQSQQLLLDLTENAPENVFMILTTTSLASLDEKLVSRFERQEFTTLQKADAKELLSSVARKEGVEPMPDDLFAQLYAIEGGRPRGLLVALGQYIATGSFSMAAPESEPYHAYFKEFVSYLDDVITESRKVYWDAPLAAHVRNMVDAVSPEEIRIKLLYYLGGGVIEGSRFKGPRALYRSRLFDALYDIFHPFMIAPTKADVTLRCFKAYLAARQLLAEWKQSCRDAKPSRDVSEVA